MEYKTPAGGDGVIVIRARGSPTYIACRQDPRAIVSYVTTTTSTTYGAPDHDLTSGL